MGAMIHIVYEKGGHPLTAARAYDRDLLVLAAQTAIKEALERADRMAGIDKTLEKVQKEEAKKLRKILSILIPELPHYLPGET